MTHRPSPPLCPKPPTRTRRRRRVGSSQQPRLLLPPLLSLLLLRRRWGMGRMCRLVVGPGLCVGMLCTCVEICAWLCVYRIRPLPHVSRPNHTTSNPPQKITHLLQSLKQQIKQTNKTGHQGRQHAAARHRRPLPRLGPLLPGAVRAKAAEPGQARLRPPSRGGELCVRLCSCMCGMRGLLCLFPFPFHHPSMTPTHTHIYTPNNPPTRKTGRRHRVTPSHTFHKRTNTIRRSASQTIYTPTPDPPKQTTTPNTYHRATPPRRASSVSAPASTRSGCCGCAQTRPKWPRRVFLCMHAHLWLWVDLLDSIVCVCAAV